MRSATKREHGLEIEMEPLELVFCLSFPREHSGAALQMSRARAPNASPEASRLLPPQGLYPITTSLLGHAMSLSPASSTLQPGLCAADAYMKEKCGGGGKEGIGKTKRRPSPKWNKLFY